MVLNLFTPSVNVLFSDNLACLVWGMISNPGHPISLDIFTPWVSWHFTKFLSWCRYVCFAFGWTPTNCMFHLVNYPTVCSIHSLSFNLHLCPIHILFNTLMAFAYKRSGGHLQGRYERLFCKEQIVKLTIIGLTQFFGIDKLHCFDSGLVRDCRHNSISNAFHMHLMALEHVPLKLHWFRPCFIRLREKVKPCVKMIQISQFTSRVLGIYLSWHLMYALGVWPCSKGRVRLTDR